MTPSNSSRRARMLLIAIAVSVAAPACGGPATLSMSPPGPDAPTLAVPRFEADDPRVNTAGFVGQTTRMSRVVDETTYTLMIFAVGDVLTLGAMVEGSFDGAAAWRVGDRSFTVPVTRDDRGTTEVQATGEELVGRHGGFDAFDWVNVEVPLAEWLPDGTPVALEFRSGSGTVTLPEGADAYVSELAIR